jgi:hypothetical protein
MLNFLTNVKIQNLCDFRQTYELIREILQQWTFFFFFEKTTHFNEKLYLGFKPHFSYRVHPEIYSQPFTNTLYLF